MLKGVKSLEFGAGSDNVTVSADKTVADMSLIGGDGEDSLTITSDGDATVAYNAGGFETVKIGDIGGELTFSGENVVDTSKIVITEDAGNTANFSKMAVSDLTLEATDANKILKYLLTIQV